METMLRPRAGKHGLPLTWQSSLPPCHVACSPGQPQWPEWVQLPASPGSSNRLASWQSQALEMLFRVVIA